jgi:hypothetical protein
MRTYIILCSAPNIMKTIKPIVVENLKGRYKLEDLGVDKRILLQEVL